MTDNIKQFPVHHSIGIELGTIVDEDLGDALVYIKRGGHRIEMPPMQALEVLGEFALKIWEAQRHNDEIGAISRPVGPDDVS